MTTPILATKLYIPPPRPKIVLRPRLIERLNGGLPRKLTLISAPAGYGKTTLVSAWVANLRFRRVPSRHDLRVAAESQIANRESEIKSQIAWLSLDAEDNDPIRFLTYLVAALQTIAAKMGSGVSALLRASQPAPVEALLTTLLNDIATISEHFLLVLDDYHVIEAQTVEQALAFLLEHLPPQMHVLIATREDPQLPLARLRARGQLTEVRATDLRFTPAEAAEFLNQVMGLHLSAEEIAALETRTEGWVAGLQLAALSLQGQQDAGHKDTERFIHSFTGSHRFVLDYLVEEVLLQQPESVQTFLLRTSILDRLCGPLCEALLLDPSIRGQETLEYLEQTNLFIVPLDNERRWYRYHHLFADLLRQQLQQNLSTEDESGGVAEYHIRASVWYEENGLELEAFHHATAANDVGRAERLIEGKGMPMHFRGAGAPILHWLKSLPPTTLDAWPVLWTVYASTLLVTEQPAAVEQKLQAAEAALQNTKSNNGPNAKTLDLIGRIAAIRATAAAMQNQVETIIAQSRRALEYLHPDNVAFRTSTLWKLGYAYHLQGDRVAAGQSYSEVIATGQASGNRVFTLLATIGLGNLQELNNQLQLAAQTNRSILQAMGDPPMPVAAVTYLSLARIYYEWNDLAAAQQYAQQGVALARQVENKERVIAGEVFLARLKLVQGDVSGALAQLAKAEQLARQHHFGYQIPEVVATQVLTLLRQGNVAAAAHLAQTHELAISQARVHLAQGDAPAALAVLASARRKVEDKGWADERLKVLVLQALAHQAHGEKEQAVQLLADALVLTEPEGFIRLFVDEGLPMAQLLSAASGRGIAPAYTGKLLATFPEPIAVSIPYPALRTPHSALIDPLSERELEVLQLIAQGLSNQEICQRLFLALSTVKGHNQRIFDKLQVQRRTEAIVRARQLGLL